MKSSFLIFGFLFLIGCSSPKVDNDCISESRKSVLISWGDYDMKNNQLIRGYAVKTDRTVHKLYNLRDSIGTEVLVNADDDDYCEANSKLWKTILEVQKLNVPADTIRFVRYSNLQTDYHLNGFWNNSLKAIGSKEYREVFSILNTLSPIKFEE